MSEPLEPTESKSAAALWKAQPEEKTAVNLENILNRRTEEMHARTRSEIFISIAAALLLAGVIALRFGPGNPVQQIGCALVVVWVAATIYRSRARLRRETARPDATAATGAEYYRKELERRRDHLRDGWLWEGPLFLACLILAAVSSNWRFTTFATWARVAPLIAVLALWIAYGLRRRLQQAKELQREMDEIAGTSLTK
jgi:membrane protein implicated in regulation of membrane protease activity